MNHFSLTRITKCLTLFTKQVNFAVSLVCVVVIDVITQLVMLFEPSRMFSWVYHS